MPSHELLATMVAHQVGEHIYNYGAPSICTWIVVKIRKKASYVRAQTPPLLGDCGKNKEAICIYQSYDFALQKVPYVEKMVLSYISQSFSRLTTNVGLMIFFLLHHNIAP